MCLPDAALATIRQGDAVFGIGIAPRTKVLGTRLRGMVELSAATVAPIAAGALITFARGPYAFGNANAMTPGAPGPAGTAVGYQATAGGEVTFTLESGATITVTVEPVGFATLPLAATMVALGPGVSGTFYALS